MLSLGAFVLVDEYNVLRGIVFFSKEQRKNKKKRITARFTVSCVAAAEAAATDTGSSHSVLSKACP